MQVVCFTGRLEENVDIFSALFAGFSCETLRKNCLFSTDRDDGRGLIVFSTMFIEYLFMEDFLVRDPCLDPSVSFKLFPWSLFLFSALPAMLVGNV